MIDLAIDLVAATFALTLARVATFIHFVPLLGGPNTPRSVKVGLSFAVTIVLFGNQPADLALQGAAATHGGVTWLSLGVALGREAVLGGMLGSAFALFLMPARIAGEFIAQESGLTFASVLTASGDGSSNPLAVLFETAASLLFFGLDLHHLFLVALHDSLRLYPMGGLGLPNIDLAAAVSFAEQGGLLLAAPVALCLLLTTIVLALMTRAAPQLNLYSVGFPLRVLVSLGALTILLPQMLAGVQGLFGFFVELFRLRG